MALEIFRLVGSIFVDTDAAEKSIKNTDKKATNLGESLLKGIGTAAKWSGALVAGASAAAAGLMGVSTNAASAMDVIDKGSQKIGISKQSYQEWSYVLGQNGMDIDKLETGMKTLVATMDSASSGTKSAQANFDALGISIYDADGALKNQEAILNETLYALASMENGTEKARLATELFGKAGVEMMPMLNAGAEGMKELTARSHDLGLIMSDDAVTAGVVLGDTMDDVKQSVQALGNQLGVSFMPIILMVLNLILDNMPMIQSLFSQLAPVLTGLLLGILPLLLQLAEQLLPVIFGLINDVIPIVSQIAETILPIFISLIDMLLPPIAEIVKALLPPLLGLLLPLLDLLQPILDLLQPILDLVTSILIPLADLITNLLTPLISVITKLIEFALVPLQGQFSLVSDLLSGAVSAAFDLIMNQVETVKGIFSGLIEFITGVFTGDWDKAWQGVCSIFSSIWEGIQGAFKIPINFIIDGINTFIRGINGLKIPEWVPVVGGASFSIGEIPRLEGGAVLEKGQIGLLEGNGAEAVVPLEKNQRWISAVAQDMARSGIGGSSDTSQELLKAFLAFVAALPEILSEALDDTSFKFNEREFGRLVKAVK